MGDGGDDMGEKSRGVAKCRGLHETGFDDIMS